MANNLEEIADLKITVSLEGKTIVRSLKDDIIVSEDHLNSYLISSPGKTAYWMALYQKAKANADKVEVMRNRKYAELDTKIRGENPEAKEAQIKSMITLDDDYKAVENLLLERREQEGLLKSAVEAMRDLRSTLISLSANMREEMKGMPSLKQRITGQAVDGVVKRHFNHDDE